MSATRRTEYHVINGRLLPEIHKRPRGRGPWPGAKARGATLVIAIEKTPGRINVTEGRACNPELLQEALSCFFNLDGLWQQADFVQIPDEVVNLASGVTVEAVMSVVRKHDQLAKEECSTGHLFGSLYCDERLNGWAVKVSYQSFSSQTKEPLTGADCALLVDLKDDQGRRIVKVAWFQAKWVEGNPKDVLNNSKLKGQLKDMAEYTSENYAIVYSPSQVEVFRHGKRSSTATLDSVVVLMLKCKAGDRNREVILDSLDREYLVRVKVVKESADNS